jgi:hypothetical protein
MIFPYNKISKMDQIGKKKQAPEEACKKNKID